VNTSRPAPPQGVNPRAVISACTTSAKLSASTFFTNDQLGIANTLLRDFGGMNVMMVRWDKLGFSSESDS
jgi:hypothetical protein